MIVPFNVRDFIDRAELVYGDRIGVVDEPHQPADSWDSLTYREVARRARALAAGLDALGIGLGDRVAVVSHNSARLLTAFFGVCGWGRTIVPINFRLSHDEIAYIVEHSGATVLLIDPELEDTLAGIQAKHRFVMGRAADDQLLRFDTEPAEWEPDENATVAINYTSGTTARPKGVEITSRNIWVNAVTFAMHVTASDRDVYLHTLPMFHANGWGMPFALTGLGVQHIVLRKIDGQEILRRIDAHEVTLLCAAPAVVNTVLAAAADWDGPIPGHGRVRVVCAGAPPPSQTIERIETELGWEFIQIYGLTETSPLLTVNRRRQEDDELSPAEAAVKLARAGAPAVGVRLQISDQGEVLARSNVVLKGYWSQPDDTAGAIVDGWFHTGDGGHLDDEGHLTISDRKKDVIITGGENVSSIEVEDALFGHPAVAEVCVIGIPDEKWGETVKALVVLHDGTSATERELIDHARERLAHYKCPTSVEFRDALERTATGKLQKFKLRAPYWKGHDRQVN